MNLGLAHLDAVRAAAEVEPNTPVCLVGILYAALGAMGFEERRVPRAKANGTSGGGGAERRELVMHNVARVARAVQDYQTVNHLLGPTPRKLADFAAWLRTQAPQDYSEGGGGASGAGDVVGGVVPDAVHVLTLHKAKATEYPVVWMADVSEGELPIASWPGRAPVWSVMPRSLVAAPSRFDGTPEEEARLCFVGLTRAMRYQFVTAPAALPKGNKVLPPSSLLRLLQSHPAFVTDPNHAPPAASAPKLPAWQPRWRGGEDDEAEAAITQTPSELGFFFACPYQWKLRVGFGFPPPIVETLFHPDAIHSAICEFHQRELRGEFPRGVPLSDGELDALAAELVARHHHAPFALPSLLPHLRAAALRKVKAYIRDYESRAMSAGEKVEAVEQPIGTVIEGVNVVGRYDMSSYDAAGRIILDDMKTSRAAAGRDPDLLIPRIYGLGREALSGERPALVRHRIVGAGAEHDSVLEMDEVVAEDTRLRIADAARAITMNVLPARPAQGRRTCERCDPAALCFRGCGLQKPAGRAIQNQDGG